MRSLSFFLLTLLFFSCNNGPEKPANVPTADSTVSYQPSDFDFKKLEGAYAGDFGGSGDIRLIIRHATGRHAVGYSLHKGLRRNFSGSMQAEDGRFSFSLAEPGDNKYDGTFRFTIDTTNFALKGDWTPANPGNTTAKDYTLQRSWKDTASSFGEDLMYSDSLGDLTLEAAGLARYRYYPLVNGKPSAQFEEFTGNWKQSGDTYTIDWQPNAIFPSRRSIFKKTWSDDLSEEERQYYNATLKGENRALDANMMY